MERLHILYLEALNTHITLKICSYDFIFYLFTIFYLDD